MTNQRSDQASELTHQDASGRARMVDVGDKEVTQRVAVAEAQLVMAPATKARIFAGDVKKGDVLAVARIAGIQAAKRTHELIPLCHTLALSSVDIEFDEVAGAAGRIVIRSTARTCDRTGVEMEALVAASIAALTIYDMVKAIDRAMAIESVRLLEKRGGRSGEWKRDKETGTADSSEAAR